MNSCVKDNFKEDLLEWTHSKAGHSEQEVRTDRNPTSWMSSRRFLFLNVERMKS